MNRPILLAAVALICAGCVPFRAYDTPPLTGSVRASVSFAPIAGAKITVASLEKPNLASAATSDTSGQFRIQETWHRVWLLPLPYDFFYPDAAVSVSAAGYKSLETKYRELPADKDGQITISLEPHKTP